MTARSTGRSRSGRTWQRPWRTRPPIRLSTGRLAVERDYETLLTRVRKPVNGYNCYGHVFASRRTALYNLTADDVEGILREDGYEEVRADADIRCDDVVVYCDACGPTHVGVITRLDQARQMPIVLSKFDDCSGEYEHPVDDHTWATLSSIVGRMTRRVYRPRARRPTKKTGWRERLAELRG